MDKDGKDLATIGQSNACLRYVGNISGTYPQGNAERALVDEVLDSCEDFIGVLVKAAFIPDGQQKAKAVAAMLKVDVPYWAGKFEARLEENEKRGNKNGLFVGDSLTIADLKFNEAIKLMGRVPNALENARKNFKRIAGLMDAVANNEKIKAFEEQFAKNQEDSKANNKTEYKYAG